MVVAALGSRTAGARRLEVVTVTDAARLARIQPTGEVVRSAGSADTVVDHARGELVELLGLRACRFEYGTLMGKPPRLLKDGSVTGWASEEVELRLRQLPLPGSFHAA